MLILKRFLEKTEVGMICRRDERIRGFAERMLWLGDPRSRTIPIRVAR